MDQLILSTKDFYAPKGNKKCFPIKYGLGCYGDCSDCRSRTFEYLNRIKKIPFVIVNIEFDDSWNEYK